MLVAVGVVGACGDDDSGAQGGGDVEAAASNEPVRIAFFSSQAQNTFGNKIKQGAETYADANNATVEIFDGTFDPQKQFNQVQDATTTDKFDAFIIEPVDGTSIVPAAKAAAQAGIKVVAAITPIGPKHDTADPQFPEISASVLNPAVLDGEVGVEMLVEACKDIDPCNLAYLEGSRAFAFDVARLDTVKAAIEQHPNIKLVAVAEGGFAADPALKATQDIIQAHPDLSVVMSSGDQMIVGAQKALDAAGKEDVKLIGTGASADATKGIKSGRWFGSTAWLPFSSGETAAELAIKAVRGEEISEPGLFAGDLSPVGPVVTKENVGDFKPEW